MSSPQESSVFVSKFHCWTIGLIILSHTHVKICRRAFLPRSCLCLSVWLAHCSGSNVRESLRHRHVYQSGKRNVQYVTHGSPSLVEIQHQAGPSWNTSNTSNMKLVWRVAAEGCPPDTRKTPRFGQVPVPTVPEQKIETEAKEISQGPRIPGRSIFRCWKNSVSLWF